MSQAMTTVLLPPPPPEHFSGVVPAAPANSPTLPDLINAILYYQQLGLSCYQALIRQDYPNDVSNIQSPGTEAGLAEKIASMVSKDVKAELNRSLTEAKEDMNTRFTLLDKRMDEQFKKVDEQFKGVDERFNKIDERFNKIDERFKGVDERFDKIDERFKGVDERFDKIDERFKGVDERFDKIDERFQDVDKRIEKLSADTGSQLRDIVHRLETQETQSNKASQFVREANEKLDTVSSQITKFEETTRELDLSVNNLQNNRDIVAIVKQVVATEIRDVKEKVSQIDQRLGTMQTALADTQQRLKQSQRTQRLQLNHLALRGPWISIPNEEGVDPTQMPHDLPLLREHGSLNNLSREQIRQYILFYGIPPGRTRSEKSQFANTENWSTDYLEAMKKSLMLYITTPV
ncbi:hypothetical protein CTheo_6541 [Ceratobasidium theobromae]|uniref:Mug135-like C-terminal domain-containing protein n=1 Tax=Ceratobasidium theobromae TaxID=1582974 RepID=A0A5N5QEY5_9AGAM|nr:hypothetical protein CTheo_6541 [Ceratobasidium theobromae]